jgi:charged multivesicular body protein 7
MKTYESSTVTLRTMLSHPSIQRDKIDETMEAMAQASEDARDVQEAMKVGGDVALGVGDIDDAELEGELRLLVGEIEQEQEEQEGVEKLAGVAATPAGTPTQEQGKEPESAPVHA